MAFRVLSALATTASSLRVRFEEAPLYQSPIDLADASNLSNWSVTRLDTGEVAPLLATRPVEGEPLEVELVLLGHFAGPLVIYRATVADAVQSAAGAASTTPRTADFYGVSPEVPARRALRPLQDLRNAQVADELVSGALGVGSSGDYELEEGAQLLRKLLLRRLLTAVGEFYHLAALDYGFGLRPKEFYTPVALADLQRAVERQAALEPEVVAARATVVQHADGRLHFSLRVTLRGAQQSLLELTLPTA